jgi:hypothetical protein
MRAISASAWTTMDAAAPLESEVTLESSGEGDGRGGLKPYCIHTSCGSVRTLNRLRVSMWGLA